MILAPGATPENGTAAPAPLPAALPATSAPCQPVPVKEPMRRGRQSSHEARLDGRDVGSLAGGGGWARQATLGDVRTAGQSELYDDPGPALRLDAFVQLRRHDVPGIGTVARGER